MSHIDGHRDHDLHHEDGEHRTTPASTSGTVLDRWEHRIRAHLLEHDRREPRHWDVLREER